MSPDIHPEDLLDKQRAGTLTAAEGERLEAHMALCPSCRVERLIAEDFAAELALLCPADNESGVVEEVIERALEPRGAPPGVGSERAGSTTDAARIRPSREPQMRARLRRRGALVLSGVLFTGGAAAWSTGSLPWQPPPAPPTPAASVAASAAVAKAPKRRSGYVKPPAATRESEDAGAALMEDLDAGLAPSKPAPSAGELRSADSSAGEARSVPKPIASRKLTAGSSGLSAAELFDAANRARRDGQYDAALSLYQRLERKYPRSPEAHTARALRAQIELDLGRTRAAARRFDEVAKAQGPLTEVALLGRARALQRGGDNAQEALAWRELLSRFPATSHRAVAEQRLRELGGS